jgi:hypothetical protein
MVDTLRRRPWTPPPEPLSAAGTRRLPGPVYELAAVQAHVTGDRVYLATPKCAANVEDLEWDADDVARLIASLRPEDYHTSQWSAGSRGIVILDTDAYVIHYDSVAHLRGHPWRHPSYYIKFGVRHNDPSLLIWTFSCHLSQ